jgi:hypothetical protein
MIQIRPSTQSQFHVQASPWAHYFTSFSGIRDTAATSQYADGVRQRVFNLKGAKTLAEMTISTPFDPIQHADIIDFWKSHGCEFITVTITPVTCGEDPQTLGNRVIILPDVQLTSVNFGAVDRTSGQPSTIEVTFVSDNYLYG